MRADRIAAPGIITSQITAHILEDTLVIADLSGQNANVFYELALRHVVKKPLIHMIAKGEQIPFDVVPMRTIFFDITDLDDVEKTKEELKKQIHYLDAHPGMTESPLSIALDIQDLKGSEKPEERIRGELLSEMAQIKSIVLDLQSRVIPTSIFTPGLGVVPPIRTAQIPILTSDLYGGGSYHTTAADISKVPPTAPSVPEARKPTK